MSEHLRKFDTIVPGVLTVCTYTEFAPFSYREGGEIKGSDILLLKLFARKMGLDTNFIQKPFNGLWNTPGNDECDVAAAGMLLVRRADANILKGPNDFIGRKIVVTPESTAHIDANERYLPIGVTIIPVVPSQEEIVGQILNHTVDAFGEGNVSNEYLANKYVDQYGNPLLMLADIHEMEIPETLQFAIRSKDKRLANCLNEFICRYKTSSNN